MNDLNLSLPTIFKSRTLWTALFELVFLLLVHYSPESAYSWQAIVDASLVLSIGVITRFAGEDIALAIKTGHRNAKYDNTDNI